MTFSLDERSFEDELYETYTLCTALGVDVKPACFGKTKTGAIVRKPTTSASLWEPVPRDVFKKTDDYSEQIPAIILGQCGKRREYLVCVDIDVKGSKDGLKEIDKKYPELLSADTVKEITASGGQHLYFRTKRKLPVRLGFLKGVDLLGEQLGNPRMVFAPPALGKDIKSRHRWVPGFKPSEMEVAWLPKDFEAVWMGELEAEKKEHEKPPAEMLTDTFLLEVALPQAIEQCINTAKIEPLSPALEHKLDKLTQTISGDDYCKYTALTRNFWLKLAYLSKKVLFTDSKGNLDDHRQKEVFLDIARLFPQFQGDEETGSQWDSVYADKIKLGGGQVKRILCDELVTQVYKEYAAKLQELEDLVEHEEGVEAIPATEVERWLKGIDLDFLESLGDKFEKSLMKRKEEGCLFSGLVFLIHDVTEKKSMAVSAAVASFCLSVLFQHSYQVDSSESQPPIRLNQYTLLLAQQAWGKDGFTDIIDNFLSLFGKNSIVKNNSAQGLMSEIASQTRNPLRGGHLVLNEARTGFNFIKKSENANKNDTLTHQSQEVMNDLYSKHRTAGNRKGGNEGKTVPVKGVMFSMFGATTYRVDDAVDPILTFLDDSGGTATRVTILVEPKNPCTKKNSFSYKHAGQIGGKKKKTSFGIVQDYVAENMKAFKTRIDQNSEVGLFKKYQDFLPKFVDSEGIPCEPIIAEIGEDDLSAKDRKAKQEAEEKRLIDAQLEIDPFKGYVDNRGVRTEEVCVTLQYKNAETGEKWRLFSEKIIGDEGDPVLQRDNIIAIKNAALFAISSKKFDYMSITEEDMELGCLLAEFVSARFHYYSKPYRQSTSAKYTGQGKEDRALEEQIYAALKKLDTKGDGQPQWHGWGVLRGQIRGLRKYNAEIFTMNGACVGAELFEHRANPSGKGFQFRRIDG